MRDRRIRESTTARVDPGNLAEREAEIRPFRGSNDLVHHHRRERHPDLVLEHIGGIDTFGHRRDLGNAHQLHTAPCFVAQKLQGCEGLTVHRPPETGSRQPERRPQERDGMTGCGAIDHHEVCLTAIRDLADLAQGHQISHSDRSGCDHIDDSGVRQTSGDAIQSMGPEVVEECFVGSDAAYPDLAPTLSAAPQQRLLKGRRARR